MKVNQWILLSIVVMFSLTIRVWKLDSLPAGFFCDEASLGYNAWAISHFKIDETGAELPLYARSLGVLKNPVFVYSSMIPISIFGLSEWSVRLTSAVYGSLTVLGVFWLVYQIQGFLPGILACFFISILPWNFHFSRIAFELITWPCLFVWAMAFFLKAIRKGGWYWLATASLMGISLHSYVMAMAFLPLFLPVLVLIYLTKFRAHIKWFSAGLLLFLLIAVPAVRHHLRTGESEHYSYVAWWSQAKDQPLQVKVSRLAENYGHFFTQHFLVTHGDPNPRHSLRNHGPIYRSLFYASIAGIVLGFFAPSRYFWLLMAWTALYPLGSALTIDRYATRSIIGSPLAALWAAFALARLFSLFDKVKVRFLPVIMRSLLIGTVLFFVGNDAFAYFTRYATSYNQESAHGLYGFQYGYREIIQFMESRRDEFDRLILTAHNVNEPYIFCLFYNQINPHKFLETHDLGYEIFRSYDFSRYSLDQRILYAIHPDELIYFDSYQIHHVVIGFGGEKIVYIIEPLRFRPSLVEWSLRGLFRRKQDHDCQSEYFDPASDFVTPVKSLTGDAFWIYPDLSPPLVDLQWQFRDADPDHPFNPEYVEAQGVSWIYFDSRVSGYIELIGSHDFISVWLNGKRILGPRLIHPENLVKVPFTADPGWNELAFHACEGYGDWNFVMSLRDLEGNELEPVRYRIAPPGLDTFPVKPLEDFSETAGNSEAILDSNV